MTSSDKSAPYADRSYRSAAGIAGGVVMLALGLWLGGDAVFGGHGRTPWIALAGLLLAVPLIVAFTLRPVVFAGDERLRVRNPFRTITVPWSAVEEIRSGYSTELFAGGRKYQVWAIPVSFRARKRAARVSARADAAVPGGDPARAWSDQAVNEIRELRDRNAGGEAGQGEVSVRWAYEVIGPAVVGAVVLGILLAVG
jgi:hypothetical protein